MKAKLIICLALVLGGVRFDIRAGAAIVYPKEPEGGRQIVMKFASHFVGKNLPPFKGIRSTNELTLAPPIREYYVSPQDLASGLFLATARAGDWAYVFLDGTNAVGSENLMPAGKNGVLKFAGLYDPDSFTKVLQFAEQLPEINKQDYEVRRLECAPILFRAIWLHGKTDDIIVSLPETFGRWQAYRPYSEREMIHLLKPEAEKKLAEPPGLD
jgi:hypothetical protein